MCISYTDYLRGKKCHRNNNIYTTGGHLFQLTYTLSVLSYTTL